MNAKGLFSKRIIYLQSEEYKITKETSLEIEMESEEYGIVILSIDPEWHAELSKIPGVKINKTIKEYYKGTEEHTGYMEYTVEFEIKNNQFKWETFLFTDNYKASERYYIRENETLKPFSKKQLSNEERNILEKIKQITREQLKRGKYLRLRMLFNSIQFTN